MNRKELFEASLRAAARDATDNEPKARFPTLSQSYCATRLSILVANGMPLEILVGKVDEDGDLISLWEDSGRFEPVPEEVLRRDDELGFQPANDRRSQPSALRKLLLVG